LLLPELLVELLPELLNLDELPLLELLLVMPSLPHVPPKKEHNTKPNNKIKKRNNASVFIV
jgi:hypothetical protein